MARKAPPRNVLAGKTATVSLARNGLVIEVQEVRAVDAALVAQGLLDAIRGLEKTGYDELVLDAGAVTSHVIEVAEDAGMTGHAKRVGFTI